MNEVSLVWQFLIGLFQENNLVNTISIVPTFEMDLNKENIYPLVNIDLRETRTNEDHIVLMYRISIIQQVDVVPRKTDNKLLTNVNIIDCLNETQSIGQRVLNQLLKQHNDLNIEVDNYTNFTRFRGSLSGVEGWQFDLDLITENLGSSC